MECTSYTTYRLLTIDEVMGKLNMSGQAQETVKEKYMAIRYDFLIGFNSESTVGAYYALFTGELIWPLAGHHFISSPYGTRIHPTLGTLRMHYGIDIPAPPGTPITAPADGKIQSIVWSDALGWVITIDHGVDDNGKHIITNYQHCGKTSIRAGKEIKAGQSFGEVGNETSMGYLSTGPHLHFEVKIDGVNQDPAGFFTRR